MFICNVILLLNQNYLIKYKKKVEKIIIITIHNLNWSFYITKNSSKIFQILYKNHHKLLLSNNLLFNGRLT